MVAPERLKTTTPLSQVWLTLQVLYSYSVTVSPRGMRCRGLPLSYWRKQPVVGVTRQWPKRRLITTVFEGVIHISLLLGISTMCNH